MYFISFQGIACTYNPRQPESDLQRPTHLQNSRLPVPISSTRRAVNSEMTTYACATNSFVETRISRSSKHVSEAHTQTLPNPERTRGPDRNPHRIAHWNMPQPDPTPNRRPQGLDRRSSMAIQTVQPQPNEHHNQFKGPRTENLHEWSRPPWNKAPTSSQRGARPGQRHLQI